MAATTVTSLLPTSLASPTIRKRLRKSEDGQDNSPLGSNSSFLDSYPNDENEPPMKIQKLQMDPLALISSSPKPGSQSAQKLRPVESTTENMRNQEAFHKKLSFPTESASGSQQGLKREGSASNVDSTDTLFSPCFAKASVKQPDSNNENDTKREGAEEDSSEFDGFLDDSTTNNSVDSNELFSFCADNVCIHVLDSDDLQDDDSSCDLEEALAAERNNQTEENEEDSVEFDPYLFIKYLPPVPEHFLEREPHLPEKSRSTPRHTLALDLDETLVHCGTEFLPGADHVFNLAVGGQEITVWGRVRPYVTEFLRKASQHFELVVFTASQKVYADKILDIIDPHRYIQHRLYRDSCVYVEGNFLKELGILGRDLSTVTIIDNSITAFSYQVDNGIPITSWYEDPQDTELLTLLPFLKGLSESSDVRPLIRRKFKTQDLVDAAPSLDILGYL